MWGVWFLQYAPESSVEAPVADEMANAAPFRNVLIVVRVKIPPVQPVAIPTTRVTLPAELVFHKISNDNTLSVEAIIPDPCMWTPKMPHLYQADVEARRGNEIVAEYHGPVGLRRLAPRRPVDFAPGTG